MTHKALYYENINLMLLQSEFLQTAMCSHRAHNHAELSCAQSFDVCMFWYCVNALRKHVCMHKLLILSSSTWKRKAKMTNTSKYTAKQDKIFKSEQCQTSQGQEKI